jgi:hypothetical protein
MPMFTQKHYVAIASLIHQRRLAIKTQQEPDYPNEQSAGIDAVNEITNDLVKLFKADNPKFRDLIFVEACCKDMRDGT